MFSLEPQFFDIFGVTGFIYIVVLSFLALRGTSIPKWALIILFLVGITGLLVDSRIVYISYLR